MKQDTVDSIAQFLEMVKKRPFMYTGTDDPAAMVIFLGGFRAGCQLFGPKEMSIHSDNLYENVVVEHGWEWTSRHPWHEMRERGLSSTEIIQEILGIELEVWKRRYDYEEPIS